MITALLAEQLIWDIPHLVFTMMITCSYILYVKHNPPPSIKPLQPILFLVGIWLLYVMIGSPLLAFSYLSFSFHMIQMSFLFFIIPPLILLGIPERLYKKMEAFYLKWKMPAIIEPKIALISFAILFLLYHLPNILSILTDYPILQKTYVILLFLLSFRMVWPIASPNPRDRFLTEKRKKYLWQSSVYIMPACMVFIISALFGSMNNPFLGEVAAHLCLPADRTIQVLPAPFNTKYDQMLAGFFMIGLHKIGLVVTCRLEKNVYKEIMKNEQICQE
ncbi:cytochrome c oxidase assembly protein [Pseudogracilibacillus sp. SO30301A]|uniref:cytochrome c oxidase assembly protein n=1 Tax=Pseudogracilibacillus sp. SO30301A TaxID=3098291 RepID=UPI00300DF100